MTTSKRRLSRSVYTFFLISVLHVHLLLRHTVSAQDTTLANVIVRDDSHKTENISKYGIDPLIAAVVVKTYDTLGIDSFESETIFQDGQLVGNWKGCGADGVQFKDCNVISAYRERLSIEYKFDRNRGDEYTLHEATVENKTTGAIAELTDLSFRDDLRFTVLFHCIKRSSATSRVVFDMTIPLLKDYAIKVRFTKNCTSGVHPYVRLGAVEEDTPRLLPLPLQSISASPTALTTVLFLRVLSPAESQIHGLPVLNSSNNDIKVTLRGVSAEETVVVGKDLRFSVIYECIVNGASDVNLVIPLPPWEDIRLRIDKKCGGRVPEMLSIGTTSYSNDIVERGMPTPRFAVSDQSISEIGVFKIAEETTSMKLYMTNTNNDSDETLHLGRIHFTVSSGNVLKVVGRKFGDTPISTLGPGEQLIEEVRFICTQEGRTKVMVSIPILHYEVLDFQLEKHCREPLSYKESGIESWWTVDGVEHLAFISGVLILLGLCVRAKGNDRGGFKNMLMGGGYRRVARSDESR